MECSNHWEMQNDVNRASAERILHSILLSRQFLMQNLAKLTPFSETIFFCQQKVKESNLLHELQFKWDDHHLIGIDVKWILNIFWKTNFQEVNRVSQKDIKWWIMDMPTSTFSFVSKNLRIWIFCKKYNQGRWSQSDWDWCYMNSECILKDQFCGNLLWHE